MYRDPTDMEGHPRMGSGPINKDPHGYERWAKENVPALKQQLRGVFGGTFGPHECPMDGEVVNEERVIGTIKDPALQGLYALMTGQYGDDALRSIFWRIIRQEFKIERSIGGVRIRLRKDWQVVILPLICVVRVATPLKVNGKERPTMIPLPTYRF